MKLQPEIREALGKMLHDATMQYGLENQPGSIAPDWQETADYYQEQCRVVGEKMYLLGLEQAAITAEVWGQDFNLIKEAEFAKHIAWIIRNGPVTSNYIGRPTPPEPEMKGEE